MKKRVSLSGAEKTIQAIWDWYEVQSKLSLGKKNQLLAELRKGGAVSDPVFSAMSLEDIHEFFRELDYLTMFDLLAATEATIRLDYRNRARGRKRDNVSKEFRRLYSDHGYDVGLESDILATWKRLVPGTTRAVGEFNGALRLRHWLAHGRYWEPTLGRDYTPVDIYEIAYNLLEAIRA